MKRNLFDNIIKIIRSGFFGSKSQFAIDVEKSVRYLNSIKKPLDDIERSYAQYKCQCFLRRNTANFLLNVGCFFVIIPYIIKGLLGKSSFKENKDIVYSISILDSRIIPSSLKREYPNELITNEFDGTLLKTEDLGFIWRVYIRHPLSFFFVLRIIIKISFYRYFIEEYHPKAIAINSEFSSASSVMTAYCENVGISHFNIMHGEKLYFIRDSFFRFSRCYVWDEYYKDLFISLRADYSQFIIEKPESVLFDVSKYKGKRQMIDYKYMLNGNSKLEEIAAALHKIRDKGFRVMVRPHPAYTNIELVKLFFEEDEIEPCTVTIEESLSNSQNVISLYSTVLLQAYFSGINIVMDDLNYDKEYQKLKELKYILINKNHQKLSELV